MNLFIDALGACVQADVVCSRAVIFRILFTFSNDLRGFSFFSYAAEQVKGHSAFIAWHSLYIHWPWCPFWGWFFNDLISFFLASWSQILDSHESSLKILFSKKIIISNVLTTWCLVCSIHFQCSLYLYSLFQNNEYLCFLLFILCRLAWCLPILWEFKNNQLLVCSVP